MEFTIGEVAEPADDSPVDFKACSVAGCDEAVAPYGGRGPRPTKCDAHKKQTVSTGKRRGSSARDAVAAASVLDSWNSLAAFSLFIAGMPATHDAIALAQPGFRQQVEVYLEGNPEMCKTILKLGKSSSAAGLIMAYGNMAAVVLPTALVELKQRKAEREGEE